MWNTLRIRDDLSVSARRDLARKEGNRPIGAALTGRGMGGQAASACPRSAGARFQGSRSSRRFTAWSLMRARTSAR